MIVLTGRCMDVPRCEQFIGFEGDNAVETRKFMLTDESLFGFDFKLDLQNGSEVGVVDLDKEIFDDRIVLTWVIRREHIATNYVFVQLRAFSESDEIWHSECVRFGVGKSINAVDSFPAEVPSEFEQIEQRITRAKNEAELAAATSENSANKVLDAVQNAEELLEKLEGFAPGGTPDYNNLINHPQINGVTVKGERTGEDFGLQGLLTEFTLAEILEIWNKVMNS